jgi:tRNA-dependent cyclodipeptide synthase
VVDQLVSKAVAEYPEVGIFIPDVPAISTYIALGYPENRARRDKAIPQGNALRNKVLRTIETQKISSTKIRIFDWAGEGIEQNPAYQQSFRYIQDLYAVSSDFKKDADAATAEVLKDHSLSKIPMTQKEIEIGVHYLLSELAFMLFLPNYISREKAGYGYHKPWPVFERLIAGDYDGKKWENISFVLFPEFV